MQSEFIIYLSGAFFLKTYFSKSHQLVVRDTGKRKDNYPDSSLTECPKSTLTDCPDSTLTDCPKRTLTDCSNSTLTDCPDSTLTDFD